MKVTTVFFSGIVITLLVVLLTGCEKTVQPIEQEAAARPPQENVAGKLPVGGEASGQSAEIQGQEKCPVMGRPVSRSLYADYKGWRVYFCCPPCVKAFESDPEKYLQLMKEQGTELEAVPKGGPAQDN